MKIEKLILAIILGATMVAQGQTQNLPAPGFHHLHLNSTNPDAAIDFYTKQFPSTMKASLAGFPALKMGKAYILFTKVDVPAPTEPQTAIWHFGWHVTDVRENLKIYQQRKEVKLLPLYATEGGSAVFVSSDALPGTGGVLGLTKVQIAEAKAKGVKPAGGPALHTCRGPMAPLSNIKGTWLLNVLTTFTCTKRIRSVQNFGTASTLMLRRMLRGARRTPRLIAKCRAVKEPGRHWK